ncbi:translocase of chloroplast 159, chloroplastic-like isoform X2 [Asparagus officinalis]|uniref:translocase of chloroplast 159, chloroplastic-like isoform X2 n=1 Tax=Asparagus officinalis TaxID=4686 RepID=UPI00098DF626|nr:translocase of chloroplast 159, chloroplastic-like isoform X2 [Asparagus officinalis]
MPVARLTADEDVDGDETEEEEGEGFVVRVRVLDNGDDENPSLESEEEVFDEADGGLDAVARVYSSQSGNPSPFTDGVLEGNPNMNLEEDGDVRPMEVVPDTMETEEDRVLRENLNSIENSTKDGVDEHTSRDCTDETHNETSGSDCAQGNTTLDGDCIDETHSEISGSDCAQGNTSFTGEVSLESTEKDEDLKPMEVEPDNVEAEKDGEEEDSDVDQPEEIGIETGSSEFGFLDESSNAEETAGEVRVLSGNLNLTENSVKNGVGEVKPNGSVDETRKENGDHGVLDEKDEVLGTDCAQSITAFTGEMQLESVEVKLTTIEIEMDGIDECMHQGWEPADAAAREIGNVVADSNQNQEQDEEDGSVTVDSSQSDSSLNRLECWNDNKAKKKPEEDEEDGSVIVDSSESESSVNKIETRNDDKVNKKAEEDDEDGSVVDSSGPESSVNNLESKNDDEAHKKAEEDNVGAKEGGLQVSGKQMIRESKREIIRELLASASSSAATSNDTIIASNLRRILSDSYPAFLGSLGPSRSQPTILDSSNLAVDSNPEIAMTEEEKKFHNNIELVRVKFLRLAFRLGYYLEEKMVTSVLYNLERIAGTKHWKFSFQTARKKAMELEREEKDKLDFSCTILVIGKAGAGKSATINSIFEEEKSPRNLFEPETSSVRKIEGVVNGIKIRILDTPGLKLYSQDQVSNIKMLSSLKKYMKKYPPDVVLYMDRLDIQTRDFNDLPLLRTVTSTLGPSIWSNAIIVLTHASTAPPEGLDGRPLSYETCIEERSYVIQQSITLATGDMNLMRPVALVENHPSCRRNTKGERVLPNGCRWRSKLLLLCCRSKILSEANALSP